MSDIIVPKASESVTEADIGSWKKNNGDFVQMDEVILELETDKSSLDITAPVSGILEIIAQEGDTVQVGSIIGKIQESTEAPKKEESVQPSTNSQASATKEDSLFASIAAQKMIDENNIDITQITATGKDGRITKQDVINFQNIKEKHTPLVEEKKEIAQEDSSINKEENVLNKTSSSRNIRTEKMTRLRKTIAQRLVAAQSEAAILTTFNEVDLQQVIAIRTKYKELFQKEHQVNLGFMSFFVSACCRALQKFPIINAQISDNNVLYHDYVDMGIAVSTPKGLVVPVIRSCDEMSFADIEKNIYDLAIKGRDSKLEVNDLTGGTFTITNGGIFGSMLSTPILNRPQSAILGMHNIVKRAVVVNDEITIRPMMYIALSYDHRLIDGADAVRFLKKVKDLLEDPTSLLLNI